MFDKSGNCTAMAITPEAIERFTQLEDALAEMFERNEDAAVKIAQRNGLDMLLAAWVVYRARRSTEAQPLPPMYRKMY